MTARAASSLVNSQTPVQIRLQDEPTYRWNGRMDFVDNSLDTGSGTIRGRAVVDNPNYFLTPGMFGHLRLLGSGAYNGLLIPDQAIVTDQSRQLVYVVGADDKVTQRVIEPGPLLNGLRVIRSGIGAGDRGGDRRRAARQAGLKVTPKPGKIVAATAGRAGSERDYVAPPGDLGHRRRRDEIGAAAMKLSHFFIDRPVFAAVVAILITLVGGIAYPTLPIAQYPEITPPTVNVSATYPGASAETLADTVATPIEEQINGVENMLYMSSQSTGDGHLTITVTFKLGTDPNAAQVLVENRVATATPLLPAEVVASGVTVRKSSTDFLMAVHMYSPDGSLDQSYIANYFGLHVHDALLRLPGVGDIGSRAARDYSMRIWIDPDRAAARGLTTDDIVAALKAHNVQVAAGSVGQPPQNLGAGAFQLNVEALGRLTTTRQFGDIIIKTDPQGRQTRVSDVARVELGAADYTTDAFLDQKPAVAVGILQQPGSNALQTADSIISQMKELKKSFPPGLDYKIIYNPTEYVHASIDEVEKTLFEALILVVLVVMIFLQSWRAAIIPIVAIPVSLVGTFAVMAAFGFSLNNLSLFGLVLSIGIVVDDAIVVVENIERHLREGMSAREAAHLTMDEVGGALVAIALVLTAVFVPTAFISGISGQFYKQFALTIATATLISLIVSLTLSPALAALIMRAHHQEEGEVVTWRRRPLARFGELFNHSFDNLSHGYSRLIHRLVHLVVIMLVLYAGLLLLTGWRLTATPRGFIPAQDQGNLIVAASLPPGASLNRTDVIMHDVTKRILGAPGAQAASVNSGVDPTTNTTASNGGQIFLILKPFAERLKQHLTLQGMIADLRKRVGGITGADVKVIPPPPVRGLGTLGGFKMIVEDQGGHGSRELELVTNQLAQAATHDPAISAAFPSFNTKTPRLFADIDRSKAEMLHVPDAAPCSTRCRPISARPSSMTSTCSATLFRSWPRPTHRSAATSPRSASCRPGPTPAPWFP